MKMSATAKPIATFRPKFSAIKLYPDRVVGPTGSSGRLEGVRARVETRGWRGQVTYVVIEGPYVSIAAECGSRSKLARRQAERFCAQVNSAAMRYAPS